MNYHEHTYPTRGGLLVFGKRRDELFPDPFIRLIRFEGTTKSSAIDHLDIKSSLPIAIDETLAFIRRNISVKAVIQAMRREDIPQYSHESDETRDLIRKPLLERLSLQGVCRVTGVSQKWLLDFIKQEYDRVPSDLDVKVPPESTGLILERLEADEIDLSWAKRKTRFGFG